jgi:heme/copper-type cytochrome/quinol oxidase subunit 2
MRALRIALTSTCFLAFVGILSTPLVLQLRPAPGAAAKERSVFLVLITSYAGVLFVLLALIVFLSWRLLRRQQEEYLVASQENMRALIEGTLTDHAKKTVQADDAE